MRAEAHEDISLVTLLVGATASGLEVLTREERWLPIEAAPGTLVVNVGDMLQRLTNKVYPSTTHRVVNPTGAAAGVSRYSMPFFLAPNMEYGDQDAARLHRSGRRPLPRADHRAGVL